MKQTSVFSKHGQIFLTVAEQLSVVKAADVLGMKQSSISYHLNQLEKELNVPLLDRRTKPISLTPEGKLLFDELSYEQRHLTEFLSQLQQKNLHAPVIRFGIIESLSSSLGTDLIQCFFSKSQHMKMLSGTSERLIHLLENDEIDWAITSRTPDALKFSKTVLFEEPSVLATPKSLKFPTDHPTWDNLKYCGLPFLRYNRSSGGDVITESMLNSLSLHLPYRLQVDTGGVMVRLIQKGIGWSFLRPATLLQHSEFVNSLNILPMPSPVITRKIVLIHKKNSHIFGYEEIKQKSIEFLNGQFKRDLTQLIPWLYKS